MFNFFHSSSSGLGGNTGQLFEPSVHVGASWVQGPKVLSGRFPHASQVIPTLAKTRLETI